MKRLLFAITIILATGCAPQYPLNTNLQLQVQPTTTTRYDSSDTAAVTSKDSRKSRDVIVYETKDPVAITNLNPMPIVLSERLAVGLRQQGLTVDSTSPVVIEIDLVELQAKVSRDKMIYHIRAASRVNLRLEHNGRTLGKKYNHESSRESLDRPKVEDLEELLETQLSDTIGQILADEAIGDFIRRQ